MQISRRSALAALATLAALPVIAPRRADAAPMRIGVIGAGWLGGTVGSNWVKSGHEVLFSSRHPEELEAMARELGSRASVGTPAEAAAFGTVLLFAVPYDAIPDLGRSLSAQISGKVVLDACNPRAGSSNALTREAEANGFGETSAKYLPGSRLVRAFCSVDATAIAASYDRQGDKLAVPFAGDDADAMAVASQLVVDAGCDPVALGNLAQGRRIQRGTAGYRANVNAARLRTLLEM